MAMRGPHPGVLRGSRRRRVQQQVPLTAEQLKEYWEANYVNETTNVYAPDIGMEGWTPIGDVPSWRPSASSSGAGAGGGGVDRAEREFFVVDGAGQQQGPLTAEQLKPVLGRQLRERRRTCTRPTAGWRGWTPIGQLPDLLSYCNGYASAAAEEASVEEAIARQAAEAKAKRDADRAALYGGAAPAPAPAPAVPRRRRSRWTSRRRRRRWR